VLPGVTVHPVLRAVAGVRVNATESITAQVVGVDPDALPRVRSWSRVAGEINAAEAARRLTVPAPAEPPGIALPADVRRLVFPVSGDAVPIELVAWLRSPDGRDIGLSLRAEDGRLVADLPEAALARATGLDGGGALRLFAFTLAEESGYATRHQHRIGEGNTDVSVVAGHLVLGPPEGVPSASWAGWNSPNARVTADGSRLTVTYALTGARIVVRVGAGGDPLPVLTDPVTATQASGGLLQLVINGNEPVTARVVGVLPRFPTAGERFVVADNAALGTALDIQEPGTGAVSELWLWAPDDRAGALREALAAAPYDRLTVDLRRTRRAQLEADPIGRGATGLLTASALLALVAAVLALVLLVIADRRDDSQELYTWESDGMPPPTLRRALFARAAAVVAVAVPGGLLVGLALSRVTNGLVLLTAVGTTPVPPLALAVDPLWTGTVVAGGIGVGLAAAGAVAAAALRERMPTRPEEWL
jgi:hypothetical protein